MNLSNFKSYINKTILDRGYDYYLEGNVVEVHEQGKNEFVFYIEGSDDYEVSVDIGDNGDILYSECDCPYDFGPVCKHEVAAYYTLAKMLIHTTASDQVPNTTNKHSSLYEVLHNLSKEELIKIIIDITQNDDALENSLMMKYFKGDNEQELEVCRELINAIVRKYTSREGFIKYIDTGSFVNELDDVLEKARNTEDGLIALDISLLLIEEAMDAFQYADDSGGQIGLLVSETINVMKEIAVKSKGIEHQREEMFEKILAQVDNECFDGWEEFQINLLDICYEYVGDDRYRNKFRMKIESMLDEESSDRHVTYTNENLFQLLFQLIEQYGTQKEAEQFIYEHRQYSSFREKLLDKYIQQKNYYKVIEIAKEGEEQDQNYPGLLTKWKEFRYNTIKLLSLKEEQQALAKELFLNGDFKYYRDLKELARENQDEFYTSLKQELKSGKGWHNTSLFLKLIEEENDLEEMLEFVKNNPRYIEQYAEKLVKQYKVEVVDIYEEFIKSMASASSNRTAYQDVCYKIKGFRKIADGQKQRQLINELVGLYRKRPAFIDELGKIK